MKSSSKNEKFGHYQFSLMLMEESGEVKQSVKHFWNFAAKQRCCILLNHSSREVIIKL